MGAITIYSLSSDQSGTISLYQKVHCVSAGHLRKTIEPVSGFYVPCSFHKVFGCVFKLDFLF